MSHVFKHPKYYKELRASLKKEAISSDGSTDPEERAPSDKQQAIDETVPHCDIEEASSTKPQASSVKPQAASVKQEPQATSGKHPNPDAMVPASGHRKQES